MGVVFTSRMSPASSWGAIYWMVTPVSSSPLSTAQLMGAAPRYWGRMEEWTLMVASRGMFSSASGSSFP